jgi:hypothetical protein
MARSHAKRRRLPQPNADGPLKAFALRILQSKPGVAVAGTVAIAVIGAVAGSFAVLVNALRGFGMATGVPLLLVVAIAWFEYGRHQAILIALTWVAAIFVFPGLIRSGELLRKPVFRDVTPGSLAGIDEGIVYFKDATLRMDLDLVHGVPTWGKSKRVMLSSDKYHLVPVVDRSSGPGDPLTVWASHIVYNKDEPTFQKTALDWDEPLTVKAGVIHHVDEELLGAIIVGQPKKLGIRSPERPVFVYLADDPVEHARTKFVVHAAIGGLVVLAWLVSCLTVKPGRAAAE